MLPSSLIRIDPDCDTILVTNDKNLINKSLINNLNALSFDNFNQRIEQLSTKKPKTKRVENKSVIREKVLPMEENIEEMKFEPESLNSEELPSCSAFLVDFKENRKILGKLVI